MMRSVQHHVWHWRWPVGWHPWIFQRRISVWRSHGTVFQCEDSRRDGSQRDQARMAVGQHCGQCRWGWRGVLRLANGIVQKLQGLDPMMQAAVRNGVPADLRTFAAVTGLRSYLITAPNDSVEVIRRHKYQCRTGFWYFQCWCSLTFGWWEESSWISCSQIQTFSSGTVNS